mgnify:CR=1 FL=1
MNKGTASKTLDNIKWLLAIMVFAAAVIGNSYLVEVAFLYRVLGVLVLFILGLGLISITNFGINAIKLMKESGGGSIVNMSSTAALVGIPDYLAYSAAKGGIRSMTKAIAVHCRREKLRIRCNSVHPGSINTPMVQNAVKQLMNIDLDDKAEKKRKAMGIGKPQDVAHMVVYLLGDESKHVNGSEMVIDNADTVI